MDFTASRILLRNQGQKGVENVVADHLSRIPGQDLTQSELPMHDNFPDEQLFHVNSVSNQVSVPWHADITNYLAVGLIPNH